MSWRIVEGLIVVDGDIVIGHACQQAPLREVLAQRKQAQAELERAEVRKAWRQRVQLLAVAANQAEAFTTTDPWLRRMQSAATALRHRVRNHRGGSGAPVRSGHTWETGLAQAYRNARANQARTRWNKWASDTASNLRKRIRRKNEQAGHEPHQGQRTDGPGGKATIQMCIEWS